MVAYIDDFNRADQSPIADDWETINNDGVEIFSNEIRAAGLAVNGISAIRNVIRNFTADQYSQIQVTTALQTGDYVGPACRCSVGGNGYYFRVDGNAASQALYKIVSGTATQLVVYNTAAIVVGDTLRIEVVGALIKVYRNGSEIISTTDTDLASGQPGVYAHWGNTRASRADNFQADDIGATSITNITDPLNDGSTGNVLNTSGFGSDISSLTVRDSNTTAFSTTMLNLSGSGDNYTFDNVDITSYIEDTAGTPFDSAYWNNEAVASDGVDSATISLNIAPMTDWAVVDVSATPSTAEGSVFYGWIGVPQQYDQVYFPTTDGTSVASDGVLSTSKLSGSIPMFYFDQTDGNWKFFQVIITEIGGFSKGISTFPVTVTSIIFNSPTSITIQLGE